MANSKAEEGKQIVQKFLKTLQDLEFDVLTAMLAPDATWWVAGHPKYTPGAGVKKPVTDVVPNLKGFFATFDSFQLTLTKMASTDSSVLAEVSMRGRTAGKPSYENDVVLVCDFDLQTMLVKAVREYINAAATHGYLKEVGFSFN